LFKIPNAMKMHFHTALAFGLFLFACKGPETEAPIVLQASPEEVKQAEERLKTYAEITLSSDLEAGLAKEYKEMLPLLKEAAKLMDELFWIQAYGEKEPFLAQLTNPAVRRFAEINYGPWDRLNDNAPFIGMAGEKPAGANLYPPNMSKAEFDSLPDPKKTDLYTLIRRNSEGRLQAVPYSLAFEPQLKKAADLLNRAAGMCPDPSLADYLKKRAAAFLSNNYYESDLAWMRMKSNPVDLVIGPIETYEDKLYGYKAGFEAYVLIKDMEWSRKLERFTKLLPGLQAGLPVPAEFKPAISGEASEINAYDVVYYAGECNSGSKTIAINLPNDERIQQELGTRRLQLKNVIRAKFDKIMTPIAQELIDSTQWKHITFDAFFSTIMFHEVAHGLGVKEVVGKPGLLVRNALKEHASALEEGKADILGLYMIHQLHTMGEIEGNLQDYYVTFMAGIFRSVRFGAASAHGQANMMRFNYFLQQGAFQRSSTGKYTINMAKMEAAMKGLSALILTLQGQGDYEGVQRAFTEQGGIGSELQSDLDRLSKLGVPVDLVFKQD